MKTITVSREYRVVIPSHIRDTLGIKPRQKIQVFLYNNRIEMIPIKPIEQSLGFLKGIDTAVERDPDRA